MAAVEVERVLNVNNEFWFNTQTFIVFWLIWFDLNIEIIHNAKLTILIFELMSLFVEDTIEPYWQIVLYFVHFESVFVFNCSPIS